MVIVVADGNLLPHRERLQAQAPPPLAVTTPSAALLSLRQSFAPERTSHLE